MLFGDGGLLMAVWKKIGEGECRRDGFVLGVPFGSLFLGLYFFGFYTGEQ